MKYNHPRSALPKRKHKYSKTHLRLPEPRYTTPCYQCGENNAYCVHQRSDFKFMCENCFRKKGVRSIDPQKQWLWDHKEIESCAICQESNPRCLDFHHVHPRKKKFSIGSASPKMFRKEIDIEIRKCVVVCANCHRQLEAMKKQSSGE